MSNVWRLIAHHENSVDVVPLIRREGRVWMGWHEAGDLRVNPYGSPKEITRTLQHELPTRSSSNCANGGVCLWRFYHDMQPGDLVIVSSKRGRELVVEVVGPYEWLPEPGPPLTPDYRHSRRVRLTGLDPDTLLAQAGGMAAGENVRWTLFRCAGLITPRGKP